MAIATAVSSVVLAGCVPAAGPLPTPRVEAGGSVAAGPVAAASVESIPQMPGAPWVGDAWWRQLGDPQLDALVDEGLAGSPDLAAAIARFHKAAALAGEARAALLPTLDATGSVGESRVTLNQGFPDDFKQFLPHGWNDAGQIAGSLGFDLDLFGRNRARLAAARSAREAAAIEAGAARLTIAAAIVEAYVDLDGLVATRDLRRAAVANRDAARNLVGQRQRNGLDNLASLRLAESAAASARVDLAAAEQAVLVRRHQLAALLGKGPDRGMAIADPKLGAFSATPLPDSVTAGLAGRRPDIAAARARLEAAAANVRAARADFFPDIRVSALYGVQAVGLGLLFAHDSQFGNAGGAVSLPLFHGGALKARYGGARADYELAVADYDRVVVGAYQQLADAVTARESLARRAADATAAAAAADEALRIVELRYRAGLTGFAEVLTIEDRAIVARIVKSAVDAAARSADVALVRALGGGYAGGTPSAPPQSSTTTPPNSGNLPHE